MKTILILIFVLSFLFTLNAFAEKGFYLGVLGGYSAQKPSLKDVEFNTNTTFLYGLRAGFKFMMITVEASYFQAAHNIELKEYVTFEWGGRKLEYSFLGLNLKYSFSLPLIHPYITVGSGIYKAHIEDVDEDKERGYNLGLGFELMLGKKFSLLGEGKYHKVSLEIQEKKLDLGDFTFSLGLNIYF
jgi:opacity protein-like surface antigen